MFGLPLVLYPVLAIGISALVGSRAKELSSQKDRVAVVNAEAAPHLVEILTKGGEKGENAVNVVPVPPDADAALRQGGEKGLDALVTVPDGAEAKAIDGQTIAVDLRLNHSRTSADFVQRKLDKAMDRYERWIVERRLSARGVTGDVLDPLKVATSDVSSGGERFGHILAGSLPVLLLMTGMLGALFPALNATTTERELGTLETLLVTPAGRTELLLAKGALVLLCSLLTSGLNLLSMSMVLLRSLTMVKPELAASFTIPPAALALSYLAAVPALVFFSAVVLIVGLIARNFREANSFATPAMLIPLVALGIGIAEPRPSLGLLVTPVASTTVIIREVLTGRAPLWQFTLAWASSLLYAGLMLSVAARLFNSEQLVNPAWEPLSWSGLRGAGWAARNRPRRLPAIDAALGLFVVCLLLLFYVSPSWIRFGLIPTVLGNELLLILAPTLLAAWLARWQWRETFNWRPAAPMLLAGAAIFAIGLSPWAQFAYALQNMVWPPDPIQQQAEQELFVTSLKAWPVLTIVIAGLLAGFCEEMLFRGPIQTALVRRMPVGLALFTGAFLFGAMHMDLHGLPLRTLLGCWLAWLVWRGGSIFPAMLAHFLYDSTSLAIAAYSLHAEAAVGATTRPAQSGLHLSTADITMLAVGAVLMAIGWLLWRTANPPRLASNAAGAFDVMPASQSPSPGK
jgi:sodium transport system permease protein